MSSSDRQPKLIHVRRPLKRITVNMEPTVPLDGPVTEGPLIRVGHPLKRGTLSFEPVPQVVTILELPLIGGEKGEHALAVLHSIVQKVNEIEALRGRAGVWVDGVRSGVREGKVEIVLAPNDPTHAVETCKRVADYLFAAARQTPGVVVKVFAADQPETPVYELAA
ncbi:hypothetical protein J8F10_25145 [Gemmata sp. G18]|uniref:Uncharacterized protein n=1 Tax=Gemmata palustris TaxID=2822762 RepID=A0ABS5BXX3_9BACT|nr:hypothetical protein [Gemmata palustris]MBP3958549.1 hypothetical protein [Gemmata palustris]